MRTYLRRALALALISALALAALTASPALAQQSKGKGKGQAQASKPAAPSELFDPRLYTMDKFVKEMEAGQGTDLAGLAVLWGVGFMAGKDEGLAQVVDDTLLEKLIFQYLVVGKEKPALTFLDATKEVMRLGVELRRPAPAPAASPAPGPAPAPAPAPAPQQ